MLRKSITLSLQEKTELIKKSGKKVFSLSNPTFNAKNLKKINLNYFNLQGKLTGEEELKEIAKNYLFNDWKNINKTKHNILITNGAKAALYCVFRGLTNQNNKNICVINPNWPTYVDLIKLCDAKPFFYNTYLNENFDLNLLKLKKYLIKHKIKILVLTTPNNPTGKIIDNSTLNELIQICSLLKCYLVIDESFSSYFFNVKETILKKNFSSEYLILINSFSKNFHLQGLRLGAILCFKNLLKVFENIHIAVNGAPNSPAQIIIIKNKKNILNNEKISTAKKLNIVTNFFKSKNVDFYQPDGSFYLFPKIKNLKNFVENSEKNGLFYLSGSAFGNLYKNHYRFCFEKKTNELNSILKIMDKHDLY